MKNSVNKKWMLLSVVFLLTLGNAIAQSSKVDFSGSWKINSAKSDFGKAPAFAMHSQIIIMQKTDSISLKVIGTDQNGNPYAATAQYSLYGKKTERDIPGDKKLSGSMQLSDGKLIKLQYYNTSDKPDQPYRSVKEVWSLSGDGKTLSIEQHVEMADNPEKNNYVIKAVFDKQ